MPYSITGKVSLTYISQIFFQETATEVGEESYEYLAGPSCQRLPPPPPFRGLRGRTECEGAPTPGGNSSVDSLSSLLSHLHHQESVL